MSSVIKTVGRMFGGGAPKANTGPTASQIAASEAASAAAAQKEAEETAKRRRASQSALVGETVGSGDAPNSLRAVLLGGGSR